MLLFTRLKEFFRLLIRLDEIKSTLSLHSDLMSTVIKYTTISMSKLTHVLERLGFKRNMLL